MKEQEIHSIIDDIARDAKVIISEHLHPERIGVNEMIDVFKQSAKDWKDVGENTRKLFLELEDDVRMCFDGNKLVNEQDATEDEFTIGDVVVFIGNGCAVKDRISRILVETEMGYQVYIDDAFRSVDELVEHLKKRVHG